MRTLPALERDRVRATPLVALYALAALSAARLHALTMARLGALVLDRGHALTMYA